MRVVTDRSLASFSREMANAVLRSSVLLGFSLARASCSAMSAVRPRFLTQEEAINVDLELMSTPGFSIDQLMELAGLSVAASVEKAYPAASFASILVIAGPGNNGGDGLVAARHLKHFGYSPTVVYPKRSDKVLFTNLAHQCAVLDIPLLDALPEDFEASHSLVLDAIFGFSFRPGSIRAPFDKIVENLRAAPLPIVSVDVPSGWDVERGNADGHGLEPAMLISLTAPKLCARGFRGRHFLGGRFVPGSMVQRYGLGAWTSLYTGAELCVELPQELALQQQRESEL